MSKSLAETVDFARAVQTKQYEKRAQQVDTFVQSESAEQKLARSGKMQTAKALEALASLGGSYLQSEAKQSEERVRQLQSELADITAAEIQEDTLGNPVYGTDKFHELPLRFQTKVKRDVGLARAERQGLLAEASVPADALLDPAKLTTHMESYYDGVEVISGLDAHELMGYNQGWTKITQRVQNTAAKATTAHNEKKVEDNFKGGVAKIVTERHAEFTTLKESDAFDPTKEVSLRKSIAIDVWADTEKHIKEFKTEAGVTVDPYFAKKFTRESIIAAAKATKNPYLLENVPAEYQDEASLYFLQQARIELVDQLDAEKDKAKRDIITQSSLDSIQAETDAQDGTLQEKQDAYDADPLGSPPLTFTEKETLKKWNEQLSISSSKSSINADIFQDQLEYSIYAQQGSENPVLKDLEGNDVLHNGKQIPLDKAGLNTYVEGINGMFIEGDAKALVLNMDANLVGIDTLRFYTAGGSESASSKATVLIQGNIDRAAGKNNESRRSAFQLEMSDLHREAYEQHYYDAKVDNKWGVLNNVQKKQVAKLAQADLQAAIDQRLLQKSSGKGEVDVNGDPVGSDGVDDPRDTNRNEILELWEANKDDQAFRDEFVALGNEIPEGEVTEADLEAARLVEEAAAAAEAEAEAQRQEEIDNLMPTLEEAGYDLNSAMEAITYMVEAELDPSNTQNKRSKQYKEYWHTFNKLSESQVGALMQPIIDEAIPLIEQQMDYNDRGGMLGKRDNKKIKSLLKKMESDPRVILSEELLEAVEEVKNR
jgi:hypothetical protein